MPIRYSIDVERKLILTTAEGVLTDAEIMDHKEELLRDPALLAGMRQLTDTRAVTDLRVTPAGVAAFAGFDRARGDGMGDFKLAIVAEGDLIFGMARMYQGTTDADGDAVGIFRTPDEARAWLGISDE